MPGGYSHANLDIRILVLTIEIELAEDLISTEAWRVGELRIYGISMESRTLGDDVLLVRLFEYQLDVAAWVYIVRYRLHAD